ncbi:MAG: DUF420 domain-containing protein [Flavobacteriaceae bacterium]|nr:DUF420 domain-containing protein [Flavobacteriaceae bacterium]MCY4254052.1 DUF420 domain-containing protein [Flavobacteriaceae bacterium]
MNKELKNYKLWTWVLSIAIPVVVLILFTYKIPNARPLVELPPIYATINAVTSLVLISALIAIKMKKVQWHQRLNELAIILSVIFLVLYVIYHMTSDPTPFGGSGISRPVYYFFLISHVMLSVMVIPLVLITYFRAKAFRFEAHRKIAKITFPIWLYVAISGVVVYLLIAPYYEVVSV